MTIPVKDAKVTIVTTWTVTDTITGYVVEFSILNEALQYADILNRMQNYRDTTNRGGEWPRYRVDRGGKS